MTTLNQALIENYLEHICFKTTQKPVEYNPKLIEEFNHLYNAIRYTHQDLSIPTLKQVQKECVQIISDLFHHFQNQAQDNHEKIFFEETKNCLIEVFKEECIGFIEANKTSLPKITSPQVAQLTGQLFQDRYFISQISNESTQSILALSQSHIATFKENASQGKRTREDLSLNEGPTIRAIVAILQSEFSRLGIIEAMSHFMGCPMFVSGAALELSLPNPNAWWKNKLSQLSRSPHTLYAHLDESFHHPKSIVYLTDVSQETGPTSCYPHVYEDLQLNPLQELLGRIIGIPGAKEDSPLKTYYAKTYHQSISSENFRKHFMRLPDILKFNSHIGWDIAPDSPIEKHFTEREKFVIGPAGTALLFDGARLFHRGGLINEGERIVLQVIFSQRHSFKTRALRKLKKVVSL